MAISRDRVETTSNIITDKDHLIAAANLFNPHGWKIYTGHELVTAGITRVWVNDEIGENLPIPASHIDGFAIHEQGVVSVFYRHPHDAKANYDSVNLAKGDRIVFDRRRIVAPHQRF